MASAVEGPTAIAAESNGGENSAELDVLEFSRTLSNLQINENGLDEKGTDELVSHCLKQFNDVKSSAGCRSLAARALMYQLRKQNAAIGHHVLDILHSITIPVILKIPITNAATAAMHIEIISLLTALHHLYPEVVVADDSFPAVVNYLVLSLTSGERNDIAVAACQFWMYMPENVVPEPLVGKWCLTVALEMPSLIQSLINLMTYKEDHATYLENHPSSCTSTTPKTLPDEIESVANVRNCAALAFERVCTVGPIESVCVEFRPLIEKWVDSDDWTKKEVAILALAAFTEGAGAPELMRDSYPIIIPRVLDCYTHPRPLVRSIVCFTMPKLLVHRLRGVKDPLPRVLSCTAKCMRDPNMEVRSMATRGLAYILTSVSGDINAHVPRLVDALLRARTFELNDEMRCELYECTTHLLCREVNALSPTDFEQLVLPIIDHWCNLKWNPEGENIESQFLDPDLGVVPLSHFLTNICVYCKSFYTPYAERVFNKSCADVTEIIQYVTGDEHKDHGDVAAVAVQVDSHLLACMDVMSASFDGLGAELAKHAISHKILGFIRTILTNDAFSDSTHRAAYTLLGHVVTYDVSGVAPEQSINNFIDLIASALDSSQSSDQLCSCALWALSAIAHHPSTDAAKLFLLTDRLISIFKCIDAPPNCIINAAWALTNACAAHADQSLAVITRPDVFSHLSGLLRAEFPRHLEKAAIFRNVCTMLSPAIGKVPSDLWPLFVMSVAASDDTVANDEQLQATLRALLRDVRAHLGTSGWSHVVQEIGSHMSSVLRRRFKL